MSKGSIWLNGINIGKYWQIGPQEDYKIPLSWLKEWNEFVIFDEEGRDPSKIRLLFDEQSSNIWRLLI
jgi:beta-galactosidase